MAKANLKRAPAARKSNKTTVRDKAAPLASDHKQAITELEGLFCEIYALDDLSRRYAESPFSVITMQDATIALSFSVRSGMQEAARMIESAHAAHERIASAARMLEHFEHFMQETTCGGDPLIAKSAMSIAMLAFVQQAGRQMEQAIVSLGGAGVGYDSITDPAGGVEEEVNAELAQAKGVAA